MKTTVTRHSLCPNRPQRNRLLGRPSFFATLTLLLSSVIAGTAAQANDRPEEVNLYVNGMVCAFCAQGIIDLAGDLQAVEAARVDMDNRLVVLQLKEQGGLTDEEAHGYIKSAGYDLAHSFRVQQSSSENLDLVKERIGTDLPGSPTNVYVHEFERADEAPITLALMAMPRRQLRVLDRESEPASSSDLLGGIDLTAAPEWMQRLEDFSTAPTRQLKSNSEAQFAVHDGYLLLRLP